MFDMHLHTQFSHDGKSTINEYAKAALVKGLFAAGFAEHVDFMPECGGYGLFDYREYMSAVRSCRAEGIKVYAGAEIDYAKRVEKDIKEYLREHKFDYTICSVHMIGGVSVSDGSNTGCLCPGVVEQYYDEVEAGLEAGCFDVIGHIGIFKRGLSADFFKKAGYEEIIRAREKRLAAECARSECIIEVNTSGLSSPCGHTFPGREFLIEYYRNGGRMVCPASDAHSANMTATGFESLKSLLSKCGFEYVTMPWNKRKLQMEESNG